MAKLSWGHINLNVTDLDASVDFYERLGFEVFMPAIPYLGLSIEGGELGAEMAKALALPPGFRGRACIMQLGSTFPKLDLTEWADGAMIPAGANGETGLVRLCLASQDVHRDYAELTAAGVAFVSEPQPGENGMADVALCRDPDGNLVELIQVYLDRWPRG